MALTRTAALLRTLFRLFLYLMVYVDPPQSPAWHVHPRFCLFPVSLSLPALSLSLSLCFRLSSPLHLFHLSLLHLLSLYLLSSLLLFIAHPWFLSLVSL